MIAYFLKRKWHFEIVVVAAVRSRMRGGRSLGVNGQNKLRCKEYNSCASWESLRPNRLEAKVFFFSDTRCEQSIVIPICLDISLIAER